MVRVFLQWKYTEPNNECAMLLFKSLCLTNLKDAMPVSFDQKCLLLTLWPYLSSKQLRIQDLTFFKEWGSRTSVTLFTLQCQWIITKHLIILVIFTINIIASAKFVSIVWFSKDLFDLYKEKILKVPQTL